MALYSVSSCSLIFVTLIGVVALSVAKPNIARPVENDGPQSPLTEDELYALYQKIPPVSLAELERESSSPTGIMTGSNNKDTTELIERQEKSNHNSNLPSNDTFEDKIRMISLNNPEYRLMGPNKTEVHMSDDVGSRIMVALLNMQEEASDLLKQVSGTVESGFNDFKDSAAKVAQSLEDMLSQRSVNPANNKKVSTQQQPSVVKTSQYDLYTTDGRSVNRPEALYMAGADDSATASLDDADEPKSGFKKFLDSVGLTDENQKKAEDALVKAGSATGDALSKATSATGSALSKAGTAIGDTITKDIPDTWNKIFG